MAKNDFTAEEAQNFAQKTLCVFCLDVSGSMRGKPLEELINGLKEFQDQIKADKTTADRLEVAVTTFADDVTRQLDPTLIKGFKLPTLVAKGGTRMVDGARDAIQLVRDRKAWYKETGQPYLKPWVVLITDGEPEDDQDVAGLTSEVHDGVGKKDFEFVAIGIEGANMARLAQICPPSRPPAKMQGLKFHDFFAWLSKSMVATASAQPGQQVALPNPAAWMQGVTA